MDACLFLPAICNGSGALSLFKKPVHICYKNLYVHTAISLNTQLGYVVYKSLAYSFIYTLNKPILTLCYRKKGGKR